MVFNLPVPRFSPKSSFQRRSSSRSLSSGSTLTEALRTDPFGARSQARALETDNGADLLKLNDDLLLLANFFPDIKTEVLRELIIRFPGKSRLQLSVEQLLKYRAEWVKGRWNVPPADLTHGLPAKELFRSEDYKDATRTTLCGEFRALSRSTVEAVLAENNFSYSHARPVLQELAKKTWRYSFNIFRKKKDHDEPPSYLLERIAVAGNSAVLRSTNCPELDEELRGIFLDPHAVRRRQIQEESDQELAVSLEHVQAEAAEALYECDCCCSDTIFETMSICTDTFHVICFDCIRRTMHEALFGQGWGKSVNNERGTLKCLAPLVDDTCNGCIPQSAVSQALLAAKSGLETLHKFDDRLANESLLKSQMRLVRCPFCSYAEADPSYYSNPSHSLRWHIKPANTLATIFAFVILIDLSPLFLFFGVLISFFSRLRPREIFHASIQNISRRNRSPRFICRNPSCLRKSCLKCSKPWHDPHTCHEPLLISLRTTVEAARTAAVKRTCPRCGLSFVKESGCNKLTCVCGYAMCYLCRKALGPPANSSLRRAGEEVEEGYRHFCEHFRVNPGKPCTECRKCDLYRAEDEDAIVRRAGEDAERAWRVKEGMIGVEGLGALPGNRGAEGISVWGLVFSDRWSLQETVDWAVAKVIDVDA